MIDRNIANKAIATPIKGVVPQPGATFPYSEFKGFNKLPAPVFLGLGLGEASNQELFLIEKLNRPPPDSPFLCQSRQNGIYSSYPLLLLPLSFPNLPKTLFFFLCFALLFRLLLPLCYLPPWKEKVTLGGGRSLPMGRRNSTWFTQTRRRQWWKP